MEGKRVMPSGLEVTYRGMVYPWHCDHMGHMNVMWYVGKFDEATWQLFSSIGITAEYLRAGDRGMVAVDQRIPSGGRYWQGTRRRGDSGVSGHEGVPRRAR
jgi:hypothetical protein